MLLVNLELKKEHAILATHTAKHAQQVHQVALLLWLHTRVLKPLAMFKT